MSRKVLDSNVGESDVDYIMNSIVAQNPQLNAQIEMVHNENNAYLCKLLRVYPYEDKAYVKILNNNRNVFCRLSHEVLGNSMSINTVPKGIKKVDYDKLVDKEYIEPFDELYGVVVKVRWFDIDDEYVLFGYVNIHDDYNLKSSCEMGEVFIESGSSSISIDDERVNIMTPSLFINGLPYTEPELENYYNKTESNMIIDSMNSQIQLLVESEISEINNQNNTENNLLLNEIKSLKEDIISIKERISELEEKE